MVNVALVSVMVPLRPGWKSTVPPAGVLAIASRRDAESGVGEIGHGAGKTAVFKRLQVQRAAVSFR